MDRTELAEHLQEVDDTTPYYELLILDNDPPAWWACNIDGREIDPDVGCPDHGPRQVPGLYRVDCDRVPPHPPMWVTNGDHCDYGSPCPQCRLDVYYERDRAARQCRHWSWHRWSVTKWAAAQAYRLGVIAGYSHGNGDSCDWCVSFNLALRGKRPYILGVSRQEWRCWLVGHHSRGEEAGFGFCGKCVPWPCCGSQTLAHAAGCVEDDAQVAAVAS